MAIRSFRRIPAPCITGSDVISSMTSVCVAIALFKYPWAGPVATEVALWTVDTNELIEGRCVRMIKQRTAFDGLRA